MLSRAAIKCFFIHSKSRKWHDDDDKDKISRLQLITNRTNSQRSHYNRFYKIQLQLRSSVLSYRFLIGVFLLWQEECNRTEANSVLVLVLHIVRILHTVVNFMLKCVLIHNCIALIHYFIDPDLVLNFQQMICSNRFFSSLAIACETTQRERERERNFMLRMILSHKFYWLIQRNFA